MKITLTGYMGAGKSKVGQKLATELNLRFIDLDAEIEKDTNYSITETIFNKGELYFRKLERQKLEEILEQDNFVLSTGGGTPCYYNNIEIINKSTLSIYLQYGVSDLYERLDGQQEDRPLIAHLKGDALKEFIAKHLFERKTFYERSIISLSGKNKIVEEITSEIKNMIHE
jgi:shikimate kinase